MSVNSIVKIPASITEKYLIWIIEDDKFFSQALERSLSKQGLACQCFNSGKEFLESATAYKGTQRPVMLLDYLLQDMDAFQLLKGLLVANICFPFVVMTGYGDEKIAVKLMKSGAIDYIIKDESFLKQVNKILLQAIQKIEMTEKLELSRLELFQTAEKLKELNIRICAQNLELEKEKAKTDRLLHATLPRKIAKELLENGTTSPKQYKAVSILFADVIGFSDLARIEPPIELVNKLNNYFCVIDEIVEEFGLEKIKTIGDCYMCAGGIPEEDPNNPVKTVLAGLHIQAAVRNLKVKYGPLLSKFRFRLGIHTGDVVAGVVGKNKFLYDIWGDAVNIASRIVEAGEENKVNISEQTYSFIKDYFSFTERGNVLTKRNIPIKMYFVDKLLPQFAKDEDGITPNESFFQSLELANPIRRN